MSNGEDFAERLDEQLTAGEWAVHGERLLGAKDPDPNPDLIPEEDVIEPAPDQEPVELTEDEQ
jgi:hypothetical protein